VGIQFGEPLGVGIALGTTKVGELSVGESLSSVGSRVSDEKLETNLGLEVAEDAQGLRVVPLEHGVETVGVGSDGFGE